MGISLCLLSYKEYLNKIDNKESCKIIDFGSCVYFFPIKIGKLGANVSFLDINELCIESLIKIKGAYDDINITLVLNKDLQLPFEENSFDIVYSVSVFEHLPDIESTILEIKRILKMNGALIITFDVSLNNNYELTLSNYEKFCIILEENYNVRKQSLPILYETLQIYYNEVFVV